MPALVAEFGRRMARRRGKRYAVSVFRSRWPSGGSGFQQLTDFDASLEGVREVGLFFPPMTGGAG